MGSAGEGLCLKQIVKWNFSLLPCDRGRGRGRQRQSGQDSDSAKAGGAAHGVTAEPSSPKFINTAASHFPRAGGDPTRQRRGSVKARYRGAGSQGCPARPVPTRSVAPLSGPAPRRAGPLTGPSRAARGDDTTQSATPGGRMRTGSVPARSDWLLSGEVCARGCCALSDWRRPARAPVRARGERDWARGAGRGLARERRVRGAAGRWC